MASKTLKKKVQPKPAVGKSATPVIDSAKELLYAGLGIFSVAQQESGKLIDEGGKLFDKLVAEGARLEKKSMEMAETAVDDIRKGVESRFEDVRNQAGEDLDRIGGIFDERVAGTLKRLGIPTGNDLQELSVHVRKLTGEASKNWKQFENKFEARVSATLEKLRVPGIGDFERLGGQLQKLSDEVAVKFAGFEKDVEKRVTDLLNRHESENSGEFRVFRAAIVDLSRQVEANLEKLETAVDERVQENLAGFEVPGAAEIASLSAELKTLSAQVSALEKKVDSAARMVPVVPPAAGEASVKPAGSAESRKPTTA